MYDYKTKIEFSAGRFSRGRFQIKTDSGWIDAPTIYDHKLNGVAGTPGFGFYQKYRPHLIQQPNNGYPEGE